MRWPRQGSGILLGYDGRRLRRRSPGVERGWYRFRRLRPQDDRGLGSIAFGYDPGRLDDHRFLAHRHRNGLALARPRLRGARYQRPLGLPSAARPRAGRRLGRSPSSCSPASATGWNGCKARASAARTWCSPASGRPWRFSAAIPTSKPRRDARSACPNIWKRCGKSLGAPRCTTSWAPRKRKPATAWPGRWKKRAPDRPVPVDAAKHRRGRRGRKRRRHRGACGRRGGRHAARQAERQEPDLRRGAPLRPATRHRSPQVGGAHRGDEQRRGAAVASHGTRPTIVRRGRRRGGRGMDGTRAGRRRAAGVVSRRGGRPRQTPARPQGLGQRRPFDNLGDRKLKGTARRCRRPA